MSTLIDSQKIGKTIKSLRMANNLTQSELADIIGYSVRNIRRIENYGTTSIDVVNTFAEFFKVSAIDILQGCFYFFYKQKNIGGLHHTMFTLICYSYTCTLGWAISSDLITSRMDFRRTMERTWLSFNFQRASANFRILISANFWGILLLVPTKLVIGDYSPSSQTLPSRTELLGSQSNNFSWDAFLQSFLSCLVG